jgi:transposase
MRDRSWNVRFADLRESTLKTARAWAIKEAAMQLWDYRSRAWARKVWDPCCQWAIRSRLKSIKRVARMVKTHLDSIVTAVVLKVNNAQPESINGHIQRVKRLACGFRNPTRFQRAIDFHLGGLQLHPELATHTRP